MRLIALILALFAVTPLGAQVVINEFLAFNRLTNLDEDGDYSDWIELLNLGAAPVDLDDYALNDDIDALRKWVFPSRTLAPGEYVLVWASGKDRTRFTTEVIEAPDSDLPFDASLIALGVDWSYLVTGDENAGAVPENWFSPDFDDASWGKGRAGLGFNSPLATTELPATFSPLLYRHRFTVNAPGALQDLVLQLRYDDAIVVYLNGVRVLSSNFSDTEEISADSRGIRVHSPEIVQRFDLGEHRSLLTAGENLIAIAVLTADRLSRQNDSIILPELGTLPPSLHTNFKLSAGGETLLLTDPLGTVVDAVIDYPEQVRDQTYGRSPDGSGPFLYNRDPSPGAANTSPTATEPLLVADPFFSRDGGIYEDPLEVAIEIDTPGAMVRYSFDGSVPTESTGLLYEGPITIDATTTLRAVAFREGWTASECMTVSYLFIADVYSDAPWSPEVLATLGISAEARLTESLLSLPTVSIVSAAEELDITDELPISLELLGSRGDAGFQINCGARYVGGHSVGAFPKKMIRLYFRNRHGPGSLDYPLFQGELFGESATDSFEQLQLHSGAHDSVFYLGANNQPPSTAQYTRNPFMTLMQHEMGQLSLHTRYVNLYLNGTYWGLYHFTERPNTDFLASYLGGEAEDYESVNGGRPVGSETAPVWERIMELGFNVPEASRHLNFSSYIDYMVLQFYAGNNWDWNPAQNWMAGGPVAADRGGFRFFSWDSDIIFRSVNDNNLSKGGPGTLFLDFIENQEFRVQFIDRVQKHLFNDGILSADRVESVYSKLAETIHDAMLSETARWQWVLGPGGTPWTRDNQWLRERQRLEESFFPFRNDILLTQLRTARTDSGANWFPRIDAPGLEPFGGVVEAGTRIDFLPAPSGTIYYTLDGSDPRLSGGAVSPDVQIAGGADSTRLLPSAAEARFFVPVDDSLGTDWIAPEFNDSGWATGQTGVGFGFDEGIEFDVTDLVKGVNTSFYLRIPFDVEDPAIFDFLVLRMKYNDGYVAHLNGEFLASNHAPEAPEWNSRAMGSRGRALALTFEDVEITDALPRVRPGRNVLALQVLNTLKISSDMLVLPEIVGSSFAGASIVIDDTTVLRARLFADGEWSALTETTFVVASPFQVSEIMYNPPPLDGSPLDNDEFEFIEFQNTGVEPFFTAGVTLEGAVRFSFPDIEVAPGAHVLVVKQRAAFESRYDTAGLVIAGEYDGNLSNDGETLVVGGPAGETIAEIAFQNSWYPETNGGGHSLVLSERATPPLNLDRKSSWQASQLIGGSPGFSESDISAGLVLPGDFNSDGRVNLFDARGYLLALFDANSVTLPCDGNLAPGGGALTVLDVNGDRSFNLADASYTLNYLFLRGKRPALGSDCVPIAGCADLCGG